MQSKLFHRKRGVNNTKTNTNQIPCDETKCVCVDNVNDNCNKENIECESNSDKVYITKTPRIIDSSLLSNDPLLILPGASPKSSFIQKFYYDGYYFDQFNLNFSGFMKADPVTVLNILRSSLCLSV